jgi:stress response protein SCP2
MRAVDAKGNEIARYNLAEDAAYNNMRTMTFGEVYKKDGDWKFRAMGDADPTDSFVNLLRQYVD